MNSGSYVDPKFLTSEDYSQTGYVHHAATEYYPGQNAASQYPSTYPANSQNSALGYGRDATVMGYSSYYPQCGALSPHMQMPAVGALPNTLPSNISGVSTLGSSAGSASTSAANSVSNNTSTTHSNLPRSPGSSPVPSGIVQSTNTPGTSGSGSSASMSSGNLHHPTQSNQHIGYHTGQTTPQPQLTPNAGDGGMSSDCSEDEASPGGNSGQIPVVYPWMKKIHVAGAGKSHLIFMRRNTFKIEMQNKI